MVENEMHGEAVLEILFGSSVFFFPQTFLTGIYSYRIIPTVVTGSGLRDPVIVFYEF